MFSLNDYIWRILIKVLKIPKNPKYPINREKLKDLIYLNAIKRVR